MAICYDPRSKEYPDREVALVETSLAARVSSAVEDLDIVLLDHLSTAVEVDLRSRPPGLVEVAEEFGDGAWRVSVANLSVVYCDLGHFAILAALERPLKTSENAFTAAILRFYGALLEAIEARGWK